jgi:hypothetical protein
LRLRGTIERRSCSTIIENVQPINQECPTNHQACPKLHSNGLMARSEKVFSIENVPRTRSPSMVLWHALKRSLNAIKNGSSYTSTQITRTCTLDYGPAERYEKVFSLSRMSKASKYTDRQIVKIFIFFESNGLYGVCYYL